ncbi:hypothetical protein DQ392_08410 [Streptomyces reniochalinae]|uniref:Uncharacterized protein n=1 Tax=Streptomyces reniochalinae TaxID=2250578 RepID=A0A367EUM4_9ACTN|nr:hypothetical protein DQ392_08410 [Streptomyces reniochalinae]
MPRPRATSPPTGDSPTAPCRWSPAPCWSSRRPCSRQPPCAPVRTAPGRRPPGRPAAADPSASLPPVRARAPTRTAEHASDPAATSSTPTHVCLPAHLEALLSDWLVLVLGLLAACLVVAAVFLVRRRRPSGEQDPTETPDVIEYMTMMIGSTAA